ncbi:hypothetical protein TREMEDRAFT_59108 [Tremella mesenterica DSM 1558]|uniref:uncharacterized protein n=1 Tax=Tremella mesenterica (strain ATCC 24925 / CBS 8224 / DSM 1558 / NBRC 9311 / NRRL Y-6157 / RJB 2259-6 / UBC 559-6) TaxID=578456 RepID=UPI0003F495C6|nr:uncharacterized protein TREMEDRAFT_59108 [Tremella mesenterica DSM 1558]EIW72949.1 hypothetical protein TREMEDRAFT_59108 [Tremella mesenterica DSM 1558]
MPTDVSPAPFRYQQQLPHGLEHPNAYALMGQAQSHGWASLPPLGGGAGVPPTGPARAVDCLAGTPRNVLPNGMRNPWAPYQGETYRPASDMIEGQAFGPELPGSGIYPASQLGGSAIVPRSRAMSFGGASIGYDGGGLGGMRGDDGWNGSAGRLHRGLAPDMSSTAGALPRLANPNNGAAWLQAPSSYANHARMNPASLFEPAIQPLGGASVYLQPPVANSANARPRRAPVVPIDGCAECVAEQREKERERQSMNSHSAHHHHRRHLTPPIAGSPLRREPAEAQALARHGSKHSSRGRREGKNECSQCSSHSHGR